MSKENGSSLVTWLIVIVIVGGLAGAGYWYWKQQAAPTVEYKTTAITRGDVIQLVTATGQLNPQTNVDVGSQVSGIISKLLVDFNSPVTNGEVIAQLDPSTYKAVVAQAAADLANSKAALELAAAEEERQKALYDSKIVAQSDFDTAVATFHQAQAQVLMKEATLQQANVNLAYCTIYAPVDGTVISRNVDVGQTVAASFSSPTLFMIANDLSKMQIDALVSEADVGGVETNQKVNFSVDAFPSRTFPGIVTQIRNAPQTNQNVITYDTVISVDNSEMKLRPGMTANVSIITAQRDDVLKIPNAALRFHPPEALGATNAMAGGPQERPPGGGYGVTGPGGGPGNGGGGRGPGGGGAGKPGGKRQHGESMTRTVYVLAKGPDGIHDVPKPVQIKIGINDGIYTQVIDGLKEGDEVIETAISSAPQAEGGRPSNPFGGGRRF